MSGEVPRDLYERELRVVERSELVAESNARLRATTAAGAGLVFLSTLLLRFIDVRPSVAIVPLAFALLLLRVGLGARRRSLRTVTRAAHVRVSHEGISVGAAELIPRSSIANAYFQPGRGIRCFDAADRLLFEATVDEAEAGEILRALGRDPLRSRVVFRGRHPILASRARRSALHLTAWLLVALALAFGALFGVFAFGVPILLQMALLAVLSLLRTRIEVGTDGIHLSALGWRRFVPLAQLRELRRDGVDLRLVMENGEEIPITPVATSTPMGETFAREAIIARIDEVRSLPIEPAPGLPIPLGRSGRSVEAWLSELEKLRSAPEEYRRASVRDDDLWRVVEDPTSPEDERVAAAVVLGGADPPRLRIVAETVASPRLRVAFEAVADESAAEDEVARALVRLESRTPP